jgi:hypothetical protein
MTKLSLLLAGAVLALGAGVVQAQAQDAPTIGALASQPGMAAQPWDVINPGANYGLNDTVSGAQGAGFAGAPGNASSQEYFGPLYQGRAATSAPPPVEETP